MPLTANLFKADPALVRTRLERCLVNNPDHLMPGTKGPEVARIQTALSTLGNVKIAQRELDGQLYGDTTVAAVLAFKKQWSILNYERKLDPIVGINTLDKLDKMMADWERRNAPPPPAPPPPPPPIVGVAGVQIGPVGFDRYIIESYYRNCGLETIGLDQAIDTTDIQFYTSLEGLLDVFLARNEKQQVIVNHGNPDNGLLMPFANGTSFNKTGAVMDRLSNLADQIEDDRSLDWRGRVMRKLENLADQLKNDDLDWKLLPHACQREFLRLAAEVGVQRDTAVRVVQKLVAVRKKKLTLHFRACHIGDGDMVEAYKDAFGAARITYHSCRLLFVVVRPRHIKPPYTAAGVFPMHESDGRRRYRLFDDPIGLLWPMIIGVLDWDGSVHVEDYTLIGKRTADQVAGWAEYLVRRWRQGNSMEFVVPFMWENAELTYYCPLEKGWARKLQSV